MSMATHTARSAAGAYHNASTSLAVDGADPHRLIEMLLERALARIAIAKGHMQREEIARKGENISGAMAIVNGLRSFLDRDAGGGLAQNLDALYEYVGRRLLEANVSDDPEALDEAAQLLREIRSAWTAIPQHERHRPAHGAPA
jgi:flagellar protein FliS